MNDGDLEDAASRAKQEFESWPYNWLNETKYNNRGSVSGRLALDDGRPAAGAAVFLGEPGNTNNQGSMYQYTSYADAHGNFEFIGVRRVKEYTLQAWSNGGSISDIQTVFSLSNITVKEQGTDLGSLTWPTLGTEEAWRIGAFDRKTLGFKLSDRPMTHGLTDLTPANLVYVVGVNNDSDWYFAQSAQGNWTVLFDVANPGNRTGLLSLSFAGYTSQNGYGLGRDSWTLPEIPPTGLNISMNENLVGTIVSENATDGALYRSAVVAGGYYFSQFHIPNDVLVKGSNRLDLYVQPLLTCSDGQANTRLRTLTQNHRWRGIMWDALKFEWN